MCDYLGSMKTFSAHVSFREEVMLLTGQKIERESWSNLTVRRPNRFRALRHGALENLEFYYDGKTMTLFRKEPNVYALEPAPPSLDEMFDLIRSKFNVDIQGSDLLYADAYSGMTDDLTDATYIGLEDVGGVRAHHLAFRDQHNKPINLGVSPVHPRPNHQHKPIRVSANQQPSPVHPPPRAAVRALRAPRAEAADNPQRKQAERDPAGCPVTKVVRVP